MERCRKGMTQGRGEVKEEDKESEGGRRVNKLGGKDGDR